MPSAKATRILRAKSELTQERIASLSEADAWLLISRLKPEPVHIVRPDEICLTGFTPSEKRELAEIVQRHGLKLVKSVTKRLRYLCTGPNAGPAKVRKATEQGATLLTREELFEVLVKGARP